jgi:hypothetical protein
MLLSAACADMQSPIGSSAEALSTQHSQAALDWANTWLAQASADGVSQNYYSGTDPKVLAQEQNGVLAANVSVCGSFTTMLIENSTSFTPSNFTNSFTKLESGCANGSNGTNSPDAAQYYYKITSCPTTGPVKFTQKATLDVVDPGDILAVKYIGSTSPTGHVMVVRSAPVQDDSLPAGPAGSLAWRVEVIDSTSSPHASIHYPDYRGGGTTTGAGTGTYIVYTDANNVPIANRWSEGTSAVYTSSQRAMAFGQLQ